MKKITTIAFLAYLQCHAQGSFEIRGELRDAPENCTVLIEKNNVIIDSIKLQKSQFILKGNLDIEPSDVELIVKSKQETYNVPLYIGNENIQFSNSITDFPFNVKLDGSKYDDDRYIYMKNVEVLHQQLEKFKMEVETHNINGTLNDSIQAMYFGKTIPKGLIEQAYTKFDQEAKNFINSKKDSHFALKILNLSKESYSKNDLETTLNQFDTSLQFTFDYVSVKNHLKNYDIEVNSRYIDFEAYNTDNEIITFSSFFEDQFVLLNFSSMYCQWCDEAKTGLKALKNKLVNKIKIVTFYIDEEPTEFQTFLKQKSSDWEILWDPERKLPKNYMNYKIQSTPTFYLFDRQGFLIKKIEKDTKNLDKEIENLIFNNQ